MIDRGGEERRMPPTLFPIGERSTRRAVARVLGGPTTDIGTFQSWQEGVVRNERGLWGSMAYLSDMRSRLMSPEA